MWQRQDVARAFGGGPYAHGGKRGAALRKHW